MSNYITYSRALLIDSLMFFGFFQKIIGRRWVSQWNKKYVLAEQELSVLLQILKKDSIVFDIGANRGELSFFFAVNCGAKEVFSFEPQHRMFGILQGVAKNIKNVIPINVALSDSVKEKILRIPVKTTGRYTPAASFEQLFENNFKEERVVVETIDSFVIKNNIAKVDFIKCDTEGHELAVFRGAEKTLARLRPLLYIEIKEANKELVFDFLKNKGYLPYKWNNETSCLATVNGTQIIRSENYYFFPTENKKWAMRTFKHQ